MVSIEAVKTGIGTEIEDVHTIKGLRWTARQSVTTTSLIRLTVIAIDNNRYW